MWSAYLARIRNNFFHEMSDLGMPMVHRKYCLGNETAPCGSVLFLSDGFFHTVTTLKLIFFERKSLSCLTSTE